MLWNACFKYHLRSHYDTWLAEQACHQYIRGGNLKPPSRSLLCQWVKSSWEAVPVEMEKDSFMSCAITTSTNGSDDDQIQCFTLEKPCEEGRRVLAEQMQNVVAGSSESNDDPFSSDEDIEETEKNEDDEEEELRRQQ